MCKVRLILLCLVSLIVLPGANCDSVLNPDPEDTIDCCGTVKGLVMIDGVKIAGQRVNLSQFGDTLSTALTNAGGVYTIEDVLFTLFKACVVNYPADVVWDAVCVEGILLSSERVETVDFTGKRSQNLSGRYAGELMVISGDRSHDPFVFNAGNGKRARFDVDVAGGAVKINAPGMSPSSFPTLTGTIDGDGNVRASGGGTIAGIDNVRVTATGRLTPDGLALDIVVGGEGELPGGQSITYWFRQ